MTLRTDDRKSARCLHFVRQLDVGTTTGHVGRDGHRAGLSGMRNHLSLTCMLLGVQHLVLDAAQAEHTAQELGGLDVSRTDEHRTALACEFYDFCYDSVIFRLLCLVDEVVLVDAGYRPVGRDHHNIELVDRPELACLSLRSTGHTRKLVVHTEIVLEGDGRECLCSSLDLHVLLRLDSLMESVAPAASFHDTAGLLVDDLDLAVGDDIIDLPVEHRICLKELSHSVYALRLKGEVRIDLIFLHLLLLCRKRRLLHLRNSRSHVRKDEEVRVFEIACDKVASLVGHVHAVLLFAHYEIELVGDERHLAFVVLDVVVLHFLEELLHARLAEELDERLIFRISLVCSEEEHSAVLLVACRDELLGIIEEGVDECLLGVIETLHERLVLDELLVLASRHRT